MRAHLLTTTAAIALLAAMPARAQNATWLANPASGDFNTAANWSPATVPIGTAFFDTSNTTALTFSAGTVIGGWTFNAGASEYTFANNQQLFFIGAGIVINGGSATISNNLGGSLQFVGSSTAGDATIANASIMSFFQNSTAGNAAITNNNSGVVDFSASTGPAGDRKLTAGSIAGAGLFQLGANELTVGGNNMSTEVSGVISGILGSLVKVGTGTLTLSGNNIYTGATNVNAGTLSVTGSIGSAGTPSGAIGVLAGATLNVGATGAIHIGANNLTNAGTVTVQNGGTLTGGAGFVGNLPGSQGTVTVSGAGSTWTNTGTLVVGGLGTGTLTIQDGGVVNSGGGGSVGLLAGSKGTVTVSGAGSTWSNSSGVNVGNRGIGTLTIADSGIVAGPVVIAANAGSIGTLNIGAGAGDPAAAPGTLTAPSVAFGAGTGTLNFNHTSTNYTFEPEISGNGSVNVLAGITTILTANNNYTGATTINGGGLIVNGSIASSSLTTVNKSAALLGSGTVGSTLVNAGGFLAPGPPGVPGTMTVAGNLALQSGAFYVVQVNPTAASTTNVSGTASLAGTVLAAFAPGSYVSRSYTILTADGGRTGTFDALAVFGLPAGFGTRVNYTGNTAVLNLRAQLVPEPEPEPPTPTPPTPTLPTVPGLPPFPEPQPSAPLPIFTVNQLNVGHAIDNFFNNGGALPPAFVSLFGLTGNNLTTALDQLSGEAATGAQKVAFQLTDQFLNLMLDPFVDGRSGVGGADHPALGFAPERKTMPPDIAHAYAAVLKAPPKAVPVYEPRWTVWGGAYGGSNRTTGDLAVIGSHDLSARTVGFAGGFDYRMTPDTVVGLAFAGGGTDWSLSQGLGGGKSDVFQAGVYGATKYGPAYLAAAFAFANHWMSTDRLAVGDHLTADFNAQSYGGRLEGGYRFGTPYGGITPYAAIQAQSFHTPGYTETGAIPNGFALTFNGRDATDTRSELGARFDRVLAVYSNAVLALRGRVAWAHDWVSDPTLTPLFQALPGASFIVNGATPAQNSALASAGAELRLANGVTLLGKFDGDFASHSSTYAGTGTIRYRW